MIVIKLYVFGPSFHLFIYSSSRNDGKATNQKFFLERNVLERLVSRKQKPGLTVTKIEPSKKIYMIYKQRVYDGQKGIPLQFSMIYLDLMKK